MKKFGRFFDLFIYASACLIGGAIAVITTSDAKQTEPYSNEFGAILTQNIVSLSKPKTTRVSHTTDPTSQALSGTDDLCLSHCLEISNRLMGADIIDDESFETLFGQMDALAAYLETNYIARMDILDLAMHTQQGNKRALIVNAFTLLPAEQREELGQALLKSENWRARVDGVNLSIMPESLTPDKAKDLYSVIAQETHPVVKTSIINGIKNAAQLKGDRVMLDNLSDILRTDTDSSVRSSAMLAKLALQKDPHDALPDTFMALTSGDVELQSSAFIALEQIYDANNLIDGGLDRIDHDAVRRALDDFMEVEINEDNEKSIGLLLTQSDRFYERHFGEAQ